MKRTLIPICASLALCLGMSGCASNSETLPSPSPSTSPTASAPASPMESPMTTVNPGGAAPASSGGVTTVSEAKRIAEEVEDELEKLSEVKDAQVVIAGNEAGVALAFDSQYQGGLDDRMKTMVKERIDSIVSGVTKIGITEDTELMDELETLGDKLDGAADMTQVKNELNAIVNKITASQA